MTLIKNKTYIIKKLYLYYYIYLYYFFIILIIKMINFYLNIL